MGRVALRCVLAVRPSVLQLHTPRSYELKETITHKLFERFRDPRCESGDEVPGTGKAYKLALYKVLKQAMHWQDENGTPYTAGQKGWWSHDPDLEFVPYRPDDRIVGYMGATAHRRSGRSTWQSLKQTKAKYEKMIAEIGRAHV